MRKGNGEKRSALRAVLSALPSTLGLPHAALKEKQRRIRRVTVETERTYIFRSRSSLCIHWCAQCGAEVQMAGVDVLARERGVSEMAIHQLMESGQLHFAEDGNGRVLVCLDSLGAARKPGQ